jgi:hypothetical protein
VITDQAFRAFLYPDIVVLGWVLWGHAMISDIFFRTEGGGGGPQPHSSRNGGHKVHGFKSITLAT